MQFIISWVLGAYGPDVPSVHPTLLHGSTRVNPETALLSDRAPGTRRTPRPELELDPVSASKCVPKWWVRWITASRGPGELLLLYSPSVLHHMYVHGNPHGRVGTQASDSTYPASISRRRLHAIIAVRTRSLPVYVYIAEEGRLSSRLRSPTVCSPRNTANTITLTS